MKVGFSEKDISPELPGDFPLADGSPRIEPVHDPLKIRAAVFDDGTTRVALVGCDVESMLRGVVLRARAEIERVCGIPPSHVLMGASHSHSAPFVTVAEPGLYDGASELVRRIAYEEYSCPSPEYVDFVVRQIAAAVTAADRDKTPATCCVGTGRESSVTFNRRFRMRDGTTWTHPGKNHPDIVEPAGDIDPDVNVVGVWDEADRFRGCVVNFGCHGTTKPGDLSADWVYYLEQTIRGVMGQDAVVVFLNGACGDVTQLNNQTDADLEVGELYARRVGQCVGAEALKVLAKAPRGDLAPVAALSETLRIRRLKPSAERVQRALATYESPPQDRGYWPLHHAKKMILLDGLVKLQPEADVEIQAIQIGPAVFLANPAEFFVKSGRRIKDASAFPVTCISEMSNGCVGYTPPAEAFGPSGGGMETWLIDYRNLVPEAEERIVQTSIRLAEQLTPGPVPDYPRIQDPYPPFAANQPQLE